MQLRRIVVVAGMHRSGTSALTRAINLAGVPLPSKQFDPSPDNADGYWEPVDIVFLHDRILSSLSSSWDDFREIPAAWFDSAASNAFGNDLGEWLKAEIAGKDALLVKDPRTCRLIPLWQRVCGALSIELHYVIAMRNPIEVARSLEARNRFPPMKSALMWLRYFIDAERFTRGQSRCFVDFDGLMRDSLSTTRTIFSALKLEIPVPESELAPSLAAALKPSLRHHVATPSDAFAQVLTPSSPPMIAYAWGLEAAAGGNPSPDALDRIHRNLLELEKGRSIHHASA